jgi:hypothetical protein
VLDELAERLERFAALRDTDSAAADAVLDELGGTSDVDRDIVVQLAGREPLAYPQRFGEAHALAMRALEVLDRNGARRVRVRTPRGLGVLRPPAEFVVQPRRLLRHPAHGRGRPRRPRRSRLRGDPPLTARAGKFLVANPANLSIVDAQGFRRGGIGCQAG